MSSLLEAADALHVGHQVAQQPCPLLGGGAGGWSMAGAAAPAVRRQVAKRTAIAANRVSQVGLCLVEFMAYLFSVSWVVLRAGGRGILAPPPVYCGSSTGERRTLNFPHFRKSESAAHPLSRVG